MINFPKLSSYFRFWKMISNKHNIHPQTSTHLVHFSDESKDETFSPNIFQKLLKFTFCIFTNIIYSRKSLTQQFSVLHQVLLGFKLSPWISDNNWRNSSRELSFYIGCSSRWISFVLRMHVSATCWSFLRVRACANIVIMHEKHFHEDEKPEDLLARKQQFGSWCNAIYRLKE